MNRWYFISLIFCCIFIGLCSGDISCHDVGGQKVVYDQRCCDYSDSGVGCGAGGQDHCCRFCFQMPSDPLGLCAATAGPITTPGPTVTLPSVCSAGSRCDHGLNCQESACTSSEQLSTPCHCGTNTYCCLQGAAATGCSSIPWTSATCNCACKMIPLPVLNCNFTQFMFSPCDPGANPYYCPSNNGCGSSSFPCPDLCYLSTNPIPYPPRPSDTGTYLPSSTQLPQNTHCGPGTQQPSSTCATQPNDPKWTHYSQRQQMCTQNNWWCPKNPVGWSPSKHQCGPPIANTAACPTATLQRQACVVSAPYHAPHWAPQPLTSSTYCDTKAGEDCNILHDAAHCVGCCQWYNPTTSCSAFWQNGKGDKCRQVSPRFNWIITTCDTNGGIEFGGACQQNPFSKVDVRYIAVYQLRQSATGNFVWSIVERSSLNWDGEKRLVDFSSLPQESNVPADGGPINSCSGGGGGWNSAFFPYNVAGATPPAMMFVLSYERFENAAWFMLNQRILNGGPDIATCSDLTNCWGEISAGEIDFLETPNLFPQQYKNSVGWNVFRLTSYNAANRCWACSHANQDGSKNIAGCGGEPAGTFYDANAESGSPGPHVWAAVVDARGTTVYKDPDWQGISASCAAPELVNLHPVEPQQRQPCQDPSKTCAMYIPGCVTNITPKMAQITNGAYSRIPMCYYVDQAVSSTCSENWWNLMMDTGQWIVNDPPLNG